MLGDALGLERRCTISESVIIHEQPGAGLVRSHRQGISLAEHQTMFTDDAVEYWSHNNAGAISLCTQLLW